MFCAMAASCLRRRTRSDRSALLNSIPSIPTAVGSSPIAAITAPRVTPASKSVRAILYLSRVMALPDSLRRAPRKFTSLRPLENTPETSPRPRRAIGCCPGGPTAKAPFQLMLWTPGSATLRPAVAEQRRRRRSAGAGCGRARCRTGIPRACTTGRMRTCSA